MQLDKNIYERELGLGTVSCPRRVARGHFLLIRCTIFSQHWEQASSSTVPISCFLTRVFGNQADVLSIIGAYKNQYKFDKYSVKPDMICAW